jgi:hypothetical protein
VVLFDETKWSKYERGGVEQKLKAGLPNESNIIQHVCIIKLSMVVINSLPG